MNLFARVSTAEQATEGVSLDAQEERLTAYATEQHIDLHSLSILRVGLYVDSKH